MREFDMPMASKNMGVPYRFPKVFPVNTIHSIRFLRVVEDKAPEKVAPLTEIFFVRPPPLPPLRGSGLMRGV
jgi:2-hydroxychromene-2-carboxylate isomerase